MIKFSLTTIGVNAQTLAGRARALRTSLGLMFLVSSHKKRLFQSYVFGAVLVVLVCQFTGCTVGPDFSQPETPGLPSDFLAKQHFSPESSTDLSQWWHSFNDPKLNSLLRRAQSQNLSLRESYERIVEARANLGLQGAQLLPDGDLIAEYSYRQNSQNAQPFVGENGFPFNLFTLGAASSWELDLFGRIKRGIEAADAELVFEQHDFQSIRQTLFADIVTSYLNIRLLQSQVTLIQNSLSIQGQTEVLVSDRREAGVSTALDSNQTKSFQHRTTALLASTRQQIELEFNRLGSLLGQAPDLSLREFVGLQPLPAIPSVPQTGFPAELLRRRPDVLREEMAVRAASARIGVAEADLYPRLSLVGTIAVSAQTVSSLFETNGLDFTIGPSFSWNILHFGRITNNIEVNRAIFRQTIASYQNTVLGAVREVEDAIINHKGNLEQFTALNQAVIADEAAVGLSLERYRAGKANFQRVLDAQQQLLNDQSQAFSAQSQAITQLVRLYRSLGGGWELDGCFAVSESHSGTSFVSDAPIYDEQNYPLENEVIWDSPADQTFLELPADQTFSEVPTEPTFSELPPSQKTLLQRSLDEESLDFNLDFE